MNDAACRKQMNTGVTAFISFVQRIHHVLETRKNRPTLPNYCGRYTFYCVWEKTIQNLPF